MFERAYTIYSIDWADREEMDVEINTAVNLYDKPNAAASIACMTSDRAQIHVLIEYWRHTDDVESSDTRTPDASPALRSSRRPRARTKADTGATADDRPTSERDRVGQRRTRGSDRADAAAVEGREAGRQPAQLREEDVPLPFAAQIAEMNELTRQVLERNVSDELRVRGFTGFHVADCPYWINRDWADCRCHAERPALADTEPIVWP